MAGAEMALAGLIVGTATKAAGGIMSGREQSRAAAFERQQYDIQSQQYQTAAARDEARRREELRASIDTIMAVRASRGVGQSSPTANAIFDDMEEHSRSDMFTAKSSFLTKGDQARMASDMAARRQRMALIAGDLGAVSAIGSAVFDVAKPLGIMRDIAAARNRSYSDPTRLGGLY